MSFKYGELVLLSDSELAQITGGSEAPKKTKDSSKEDRNLVGAAVTGAIAGVVDCAGGGPGGMAVGALGGAAVGIGAYMVGAYVSGGDKSKIPSVKDRPQKTSWADFRMLENKK